MIAFEADFKIVYSIGVAAFSICQATLLSLLLQWGKPKNRIRLAIWIILYVYLLLSLVNGISFFLYGFGISHRLFIVIAETNIREFTEFMPSLFSALCDEFFRLSTLCYAAGILMFIFLCVKAPRRIFACIAGAISVIGLLFAIYFIFTEHKSRKDLFVPLRTAVCIQHVATQMKAINGIKGHRKQLQFADTAQSCHTAENVVLVIGESASRLHMSLYGYPLPTTPRMDAISDSLFSFENVIAPSTATTESVAEITTFIDDRPTEIPWYESPSIMQLFNYLGYATSWVSNQEYSGTNSPGPVIAADASFTSFSGALHPDDNFMHEYDDILLDPFRTIFSENNIQPRFVVLHLMGSHVKYANRYPESQAKFSAQDIITQSHSPFRLNNRKAQTIAEYDNSITYTDSILEEIRAIVSGQHAPSLMIYLSDHGEQMCDNRDYIGRDNDSYHIPFIIYANDAYRRLNPDIVKRLERARHLRFSSSQLPHMLLTLTGSEYQAYIPSEDPLSDSFTPRQLYVNENKVAE